MDIHFGAASTAFVPMGERILANQASDAAVAVTCGDRAIEWGPLKANIRRVSAALAAADIAAGARVAILAPSSIDYVEIWIGALHAGAAVVPLPTGALPATIGAMLGDSRPAALFVAAALDDPVLYDGWRPPVVVTLDRYAEWRDAAAEPVTPLPVVTAEAVFNIIYSSGTTGVPKGIEHSHAKRWADTGSAAQLGLDDKSVLLSSTPFYSNTTIVPALMALTAGAHLALMPKFDEAGFLALAEQVGASHAPLVPVQVERLLAHPDFDRFDLRLLFSSSTSAPLREATKRAIVARWPGRFFEVYGMTEGGPATVLDLKAFPHKLHTVGRPAAGVEVMIVDNDDVALAPGGIGEIVGGGGIDMTGYLNRDEATDQARWTAPDGGSYIRSGDIGRFDADGFLEIMGRKKDMIISGGFNVYPPDLETVLAEHPAVSEVAVIGIPSDRWGETPIALIVPKDGAVDPIEICAWANARLGAHQRLAKVECRDSLPRNDIGKILKRALREPYWESAQR